MSGSHKKQKDVWNHPPEVHGRAAVTEGTSSHNLGDAEKHGKNSLVSSSSLFSANFGIMTASSATSSTDGTGMGAAGSISKFEMGNFASIVRAQNTIIGDVLNPRRMGRPWWDEGDMHFTRYQVAGVVFSTAFECFTAAVIVANVIIVVYQTDQEATCFPKYDEASLTDCPTLGDNVAWMRISNLLLLAYYSFEAAGKIYVAHWKYFDSSANMLDFVICVVGWLVEALVNVASLGWLRVFRLWRLLRILLSLSKIAEIHMLLEGLTGAIRAIIFGAFLLMGTLLFCSIILVQFIHPIAIQLSYDSCERCSRGFASVMDAIVTVFQQVVAGDSWGLINIPVMEKDPVKGLLLPMVQMLIAMGIMNLILAVVVDRSVEAREKNKAKMIAEQNRLKQAHKLELLSLLTDYDADMSGTLSRREIKNALEMSDRLREICSGAAVSHQEFDIILEALESETEHGEIAFGRLCTVMDDIQSVDLRKGLVVGNLLNKQEHADQARLLQAHSESLARLESKVDELLGTKFPAETDSRSVPIDPILTRDSYVSEGDSFVPAAASVGSDEQPKINTTCVEAKGDALPPGGLLTDTDRLIGAAESALVDVHIGPEFATDARLTSTIAATRLTVDRVISNLFRRDVEIANGFVQQHKLIEVASQIHRRLLHDMKQDMDKMSSLLSGEQQQGEPSASGATYAPKSGDALVGVVSHEGAQAFPGSSSTDTSRDDNKAEADPPYESSAALIGKCAIP